MKNKHLLFPIGILIIAGSAFAQNIMPASYTATPGEGIAQGGSFNYYDDTGRQLIDQVLGVNDINQNLGNGPAYEWVGWRLVNPTVTFQFSNTVSISKVRIGFHRNDYNQTAIPPLVSIGARLYATTGTELSNGTRGFVEFPGDWFTNRLVITLSHTNLNQWIFVDEVQFVSPYIVPSSYTATPGEGMAQAGALDYFDETGRQLIDQMIGTNDIYFNFGNGMAYEWVGWRTVNPTVTFQFSNIVAITSVQIGFHHNDYNKTYVPATVTIGSKSFGLTGNELANGTRGVIDFPGYWTTNSLTIKLTDNDLSRWIFVDEIRFLSEPSLIRAAIAPAVEICWNSESNHIYQVEYRTDLGSDQWYPLGEPVLATGPETCILDPARDVPTKFYRIREQEGQ